MGYARVSTEEQHLDLQLDALMKAGVAEKRIYTDVASGKNVQRKRLEACFRALRHGDTLVVWRLDRLGRSLPDLVRIIGDLEHEGVAFESLTERIETRSASGKLVFHVFAALAEFERNLIRERTKAGLAAARARGRKGGRRPKLTAAQIKEVVTKVDAKKCGSRTLRGRTTSHARRYTVWWPGGARAVKILCRKPDQSLVEIELEISHWE